MSKKRSKDHPREMEHRMTTILTNPDELPPVITPSVVAAFMHTTINSLAQDRYLGRGIPFVKFGKRVRYLRSDVLAYLAANRVQRTDDPRGFSGDPDAA
jgi:hypothetical protein